MSETRIESGIDVTTMSVLRQLPRKSRIISAVRPAAMAASLSTPSTAARTKTRLVEEQVHLVLRRQASRGARA